MTRVMLNSSDTSILLGRPRMRASLILLVLITMVAACESDDSGRARQTTVDRERGAVGRGIDTTGLLLPALEGSLYGYVTTDGAVQIEPRFRAAGLFADGLAAVREHGRYGY